MNDEGFELHGHGQWCWRILTPKTREKITELARKNNTSDELVCAAVISCYMEKYAWVRKP